MGKQEKYFVTSGLGEYMVVSEVFDPIAGNVLETHQSGFENESEAQDVADNMNKML
ncbi:MULTISPECIES: hypothetical protein [unclassified Exiguobacterium]|uniref:hypothetical protein n=1 Tax=unclassified Exiguobacterium TaxID=2644629 RepID=UPI001BEC2BD1|nr:MULTISPECIES: hypothetical protein [unclassified Exiguobacterium]